MFGTGNASTEETSLMAYKCIKSKVNQGIPEMREQGKINIQES